LFDDDAIVLKNAASGVCLCTDRDIKAIRVDYPGFPYLGIWHKPKTDAPYVCIEPWTSLPSRKGIVEDIAIQPGLIHLASGERYEISFTIRCF
jgi:galactose mutarotase-like enzyme